MPVAVLVTVTVMPGTTAPVESVTVPVIVPRIVCAACGRRRNRQKKRHPRHHLRPLSCARFPHVSPPDGSGIVSAYIR